jgi:hypothetical protein
MRNLYKTIINKLEDDRAIAIYDEFGVSKTKLIDEYEGQYLDPENFDLLDCPFVLVEYDIDYKTDKENATIVVVLHLGYEQVKRANNRTIQIDKHLKFFDYTDAVHKIVNNLETAFTGKLELVSENSLKEPAITKIHLLTYQCSYTGRNLNNNKKFNEVDGADMALTTTGTTNLFTGNL